MPFGRWRGATLSEPACPAESPTGMRTRLVSIVTLLAVAVAACSSPTKTAQAPSVASPSGEVVGVVHVVGPLQQPPTSVTSQISRPVTIRPFGSSRPRQVG